MEKERKGQGIIRKVLGKREVGKSYIGAGSRLE